MVSRDVNIQTTIERLDWICGEIPGKLGGISEAEFSKKPAGDKWSKKQILGHLIDSATNNHHRFVRAQFEDRPLIKYDQEKWNVCNYYQESEKIRLIELWENYNRHILEIVKKMPETMWQKEVRTSDAGPAVPLTELLRDYVDHMEHHLRQITRY